MKKPIPTTLPVSLLLAWIAVTSHVSGQVSGLAVDFLSDTTSTFTRTYTSGGLGPNTLAWSSTTPLLTQGAGGRNNTIYASFEERYLSGPEQFNTQTIGRQNGELKLIANYTNTSSGGANSVTEFSAMLFWDSNDFLNIADTFDSTASSALSFRYNHGTSNGGAASGRFVIRDGATYYVSNIGTDTLSFNAADTTVSIHGATPGLQWAPFNPANSVKYNNDSDVTNYNLGTLVFNTIPSFSNVTGVGVLLNTARTNSDANTAGAQIDFTGFQANLRNTVFQGGPGFPNIARTPGTILAQWLTSTTHSDRNLLAGFHRGYLWIQSRPDDGGNNLIMVYDISNPSNPVEVHRRDLPSGGVRPEHMIFMTEGDKFLMPVEARMFHDMSDMLNIRMIDDAPYSISRDGDAAAEFVQLPLQYNGQYGYATSSTPLAIRNIRTNSLLSSAINPPTNLGFKGHPLVIGNLLIAVGSRTNPGVATYDVSDPTNPILLDSITSGLDALDTGNNFVNEGGYEPAVWGSYIVYGNQDRNVPQIKVVDFSDPTNLNLVAHITNPSLRAARYQQFQDEFLFTGNAKIDMRDFSIVRNLKPSNATNQLSEYVLPLGNLVVIGEHQGTNGGKAYIIAHQDTPDTRAPFVNYHNPVANATNMHPMSRVGVVIPETLDPLSINSSSFIVRPFQGAPIGGTLTYTDKDIINFVPDSPLAANTTYEVVLPAGGIRDISGNEIEEFCYAFSTGPTINPFACTGLQKTYGNGGLPGSGLPWPVLDPGSLRIEAENFNQGGEGLGYHDSDANNVGGAFRVSEGVDVFATTDAGGGFEVGNTTAGEWLEYVIVVPATGVYDLHLRAADSSGSDADMRVFFGPDSKTLTDATGPITIENSGNPSSFVTQTLGNIPLNEGLQIMRVLFNSGGIKLNWMEIEGLAALPQALVHYDLDGDTLDQSPSGSHGMMRNFPASPFTTDATVGTEALRFDGTNDYVAIQNLVYNSGTLPSLAVSCWVKTTDGSTQVIASFDRNEYWRMSIAGDGVSPGKIGWHVMTQNGQRDLPSNRSIDDDKWHHVVGIFDGAAQEMRIYIDGALDASISGVGTVYGSGNTRYGFVGTGSEAVTFDGAQGPLDYFNGTLDDFYIFDKVLDQTQIEHLFLQRSIPNTPPVISSIDVSNYPATTGSPQTITVTASDAENDPLEYRLNPGDGSGFTEWQSSNIFTHIFAANGHFGLSLQVRDPVGAQTISTGSMTVLDSPPSGPRPTRSSPITEVGSNRVMVVNPDNNSVTSVNTATLAKEFEVPVGTDPRSIAVAGTGEIWITCHDADRLDVLSSANGSLITSINLDYGAEPYGIAFSPDGLTGFVSLQGSGNLLEINPATRTITRSLNIGPDPRAIAITSDGGRVLVTRFDSPETHGEVYEVNAASMSLTRVIQLAKDMTPDHANGGRGVPNYLTAIAIAPDGSGAWVSSKKDNIDRGAFRDGQSLNHENSVRAILSFIDLTTNAENITKRIDIDNSSMPMGIAFSPLGDFAFIAMQGNNHVQDIDMLGGAVGSRWASGKAPQGVWYVAGNDRLVTADFMDRTITIYDAYDFVRNGKGLSVLATIPTVANEALSSEVLLGKQIFYDASDPRMALDGYQSCAACHQDGGTDNRVWDFTDRGEGFRNTTDLRARRGTSQGFVHWSANFDEIQDFEHDIRNEFLGDGFLPDAVFNAGTRNTTLGDTKAGFSVELDALAAYVTSLETVGRSPHKTADGQLTSEAIAGRALFTSLNCMSCHSGDPLTNSNTTPTLHDVGTLKASSGQRLGGPLTGIDTPTLRGLWRTAPYLHDGSAATLKEALTTNNPSGLHGVTSSLTSTEIDALVAYLLQIDDCEASVNPEAKNGFVLVDDFSTYALGSNMLGQGGWNTNSTRAPITNASVVTDPSSASNQVMSLVEITANGNQAAIDNQVLAVEDGSTATLFFRMRHTALTGDPDTPMGVGSNDNGQFGNYELGFKIRSGGINGQNRTEGLPTELNNLDRDVWFNVWWVITNGAAGGTETLDLYLQSDSDADYTTRQHVATLTSAIPTTEIIDTLTFTKFNENGVLLIDGIYYDDQGINLTDPTGNYTFENNLTTASVLSSKSIGLNWSTEPGAVIYYVEQSNSPNGPWTALKRMLGNPMEFVAGGLTPVSQFFFRVTAMTADGELLSRDIVEATTQEPYDDWAKTFTFSPADYGKEQDPDGDGIINSFERAYGTNPLLPDSEKAPYLIKAAGTVQFVYRYNTEADDLILVPEMSNNLQTWEDDALWIEDTLKSTEGAVEVRQAEPVGTLPPALFMRLRIESPY